MEGCHLGRLVAAERNALAAIELAKKVSAELGDVQGENVKLTRQVIQLSEQVNALQVKIAMMRGTGPTGG